MAVDAKTGKLLWQLHRPSKKQTLGVLTKDLSDVALRVEDDLIFAAHGEVWSVRLDSGALRWTAHP